MESRLNHDSDRIEILERQLKEAKELASEADRKFEEVSKEIINNKNKRSINQSILFCCFSKLFFFYFFFVVEIPPVITYFKNK
jgi:hypothetical protein